MISMIYLAAKERKERKENSRCQEMAVRVPLTLPFLEGEQLEHALREQMERDVQSLCEKRPWL